MEVERRIPLIVTNTEDVHADALVDELTRRCVDCHRFNTDLLASEARLTLSDGVLQLSEYDHAVSSGQVSAIVWRRPSPPKPATLRGLDAQYAKFVEDECQIAVSDTLRAAHPKALWVSHPDHLRRAGYKSVQLNAARELGFVVPETLVTNDRERALIFLKKHQFRVATKVLGRGPSSIPQGKTLYTVNLGRGDSVAVELLLDDLSLTPVVFQAYVPKRYELRVTFFGERHFAVALHSQETAGSMDDWRGFDWPAGEKPTLRHEPVILPEKLTERCVAMLRLWGLNYGCFDFIYTPDGEYVFLELNANGQFLWIQEVLPDFLMVQAWADLVTGNGKPINF